MKYQYVEHIKLVNHTTIAGRWVNKKILSQIRPNITWQWNFQDIAEKFMAKETWNDPDYEAAEVGNSIARAHYFELCLAWMDSFKSHEGGSIDIRTLMSKKTYGRLLINCPIDVEVYDSNNTLVGKIVNDTPQNIENGIYTEFDENGQKVVYLPGDAEYHVVLKATDDGSVNVNFENIDLENYALTNLITYNDVQVEEGDELSLDVDISAEEEREVELRDSEDIVIEQSLNQKGDDIEYFDVNLEVIGDGSVDGFGNYPSGEFVTLKAYPKVYSTFKGWQKNGEIVTTDSEYRVQVTEEINLTAVFESGSNTLWIDGVEESYEYTGTAIKPEVKIYEGREPLVQGKDYTVTYKNNVNAYTLTEGDEGFDPKKAPTVIITGKGNYSGPDTVTFKITKSDFSSEIFAADDINISATGKEQKPKPVLKWNGKNVPTNAYSYKYYKADEEGNPQGESIASVKDAGKYVVVITANENANFTGTRTVKLNLLDEQKLVSKLSIAAISQQNYTGSPIKPGVVVKEGKTVLAEGTDYTVEYKNNTAVGTATAVITGIGGYAGTKTLTFKINGVPLSKAAVEGIIASVPYTGNDITFDNIRLYIKATKTIPEKVLAEGTDYTVSYSKNQAAGTATILFTGINGYTGTVKKTFKITPYKAAVNDTRISVSVPESVEYSKGGAKPAVTVKFINSDGTTRTLTEKTDYTVAYQKNTAVNDCSNAKNMPTVRVTLKGSYNGTISKNFKIVAKDISSVSMDVADKTYMNKKNSYASAPTLTDTDGKKLVAGKDYEKTLIYQYKDETTVVVNGEDVSRNSGDDVGKDDIIPAGTIIEVTATAKEGGNYTGTIPGEYRITRSSVASAKVTVPAQEYTGKPITINEENMTVKVGKETLTTDDFEIIEGSYQNNTNKGTASFTIKGKGNYGGTKKVTFSIKTKVFKWWWR